MVSKKGQPQNLAAGQSIFLKPIRLLSLKSGMAFYVEGHTTSIGCLALAVSSGARTNLKVGSTSPEHSAGKIFLVVPLYFFGSTSTVSHFGERFCDGQYSLVSFLFAVLLTVAPCPGIC